jgi:hypothetical protein
LGRPTERDDAIFAAGLPVELAPGNWWRATLSTFVALLFRPGASFRAVEEPVAHGPALAFVASLRLPTWAVVMAVYLLRWIDAPPDTFAVIKSSVAADVLGLQLAEVTSIWLLMMVPLRIPVLYFAAGLSGHIVMALTGGANRSIGASMRALGFAFAPLALVVGVLEFGLVLFGLSAEVWIVTFAAVALIVWVMASFALARTHEATVVRALFVALVPLAVVCIDAAGSAAFEIQQLPFLAAPAPEAAYLLPAPP